MKLDFYFRRMYWLQPSCIQVSRYILKTVTAQLKMQFDIVKVYRLNLSFIVNLVTKLRLNNVTIPEDLWFFA